MFLYSYPIYPRTSVERLFKQLYNASFLLNFIAFIVSFSSFHTRLSNTFESYWSASRFELRGTIKEILVDCPFNATVTINGISSTTTMTADSIPLLFLMMTSLIIGIFVIHGLLVVTDSVAKTFFVMNVRNFRFKGLYIRVNIIMLTFIFVYSLALIVAIAASQNIRGELQEYVKVCSERFMDRAPDRFSQTELDIDVAFGANLVWILVAVVINCCVYFLAFLFLAFHSCKDTMDVIAAEKHPWEKGALCRTDKPTLLAWLQQLRLKEELIKAGQYDPNEFAQQVQQLQLYGFEEEEGGGTAVDMPLDGEEAVDDRGDGNAENFGYRVQSAFFNDNDDDRARGTSVGLGDEVGIALEDEKRRRRHHHKSRRKSRGEQQAVGGDEENGGDSNVDDGARERSRRKSRHHQREDSAARGNADAAVDV